MAETFTEGTVVRDRYRVEGVLGRGGMGIVYAARQLDLDRAVAIKVLASTDAEFIDRFKREVKILASLSHPNVLQVLDWFAGDDATPPYLVTERLFGRTLTEAVRDGGPMTDARVTEIGLQLADALSAAHAKGVIHRDVKPGNVFLTETTLGRDAIKLLDFGVARDLHAADDLTREGAVVGTLAWLAPEQIDGRPADVQSDVWAVGATLFFCLFGRKPFPQASIGETAHAITRGKRDSARELRPNQAVAAVIDRAMEVDRAKRFATIAELAEALRGAGDARTPATEGTKPTMRLDSGSVSGSAPASGSASASGSAPASASGSAPAPAPAPARSMALPVALVVSALVLGGAAVLAAKMASSGGAVAAPSVVATPSAVVSASAAPSAVTVTATASASASAAPPVQVAPSATGGRRALRFRAVLSSLNACSDGSSWTEAYVATVSAAPVLARIESCANAHPDLMLDGAVDLDLHFDGDGKLTGIQQLRRWDYANALTRCVETVLRQQPPICRADDDRVISLRFGW